MSDGPPQPPTSLRAPFVEPPPSPLPGSLRAEAPVSAPEPYRVIGKKPRPDTKKSARGGFRRKSQTARFNRCVKSVRKTVTPRPKSTKESAAIAICTQTILQRKGRTLKKYRKGKRLLTQKRKQA